MVQLKRLLPISATSGAAAIVAALIFVSVSRTAAVKCLSCTAAARPRDCEYVQECGVHEKCSIESILTAAGYTIYNVGCTGDHKCASFGKKRAVLNATALQEIQQKDEFSAIPEEQWDQSGTDVLLCAECCSTELCNVKGCGEEGLPKDSGPVCYGCEQERSPDQCNKIVVCDRDEVCLLSSKRIGFDQVYKSQCIPRQLCQDHGFLDTGANTVIGRRQRDVDMSSKLKRTVFCNKCCTANLCNFGNCSSFTQPTTTPPQTTILAPVSGGWGAWSPWNDCSVTCGEGNHYRIRVCNKPYPTHGGAMCSGLNNETNRCWKPICPADGQWSLWTTWSVCSSICGTNGTRNRQRTCSNPQPAPGGKDCVGQPYESQRCGGLSDPQVIQRTRNFSEPAGSNIVIECLDPGSSSQQQVPSIVWLAPQTIGHEVPGNVEQAPDGSLYIIGLTVENTGPYSCQATTACGIYKSAQFWVNIQ